MSEKLEDKYDLLDTRTTKLDTENETKFADLMTKQKTFQERILGQGSHLKDINSKLEKITELETWKRRTTDRMKEMEGWNKDRKYKYDLMKKSIRDLEYKIKEFDE